MLDRILADEVDHRDRAGLMLAPGARDTLLELGRVPRQVDIDDRARDLEVEADAARIGRKKETAGGIPLEAVDLGAAALLRHRARMPCRLDAHFARKLAHQLEHALPLGEYDDLALRLLEQVGEDFFQLLELGADAA